MASSEKRGAPALIPEGVPRLVYRRDSHPDADDTLSLYSGGVRGMSRALTGSELQIIRYCLALIYNQQLLFHMHLLL